MSAIIDLKKGRFLDHPIHTILIHFPSALLPTSVVLDALGYYTEDLSYARAAYYLLTGGVGMAVLAAVFGFMDYLGIPGEKTAARKTATLHMLLNVTWLLLFGVVWGVRVSEYPALGFERPVLFAISVLAMLLLLVSNHLGGDLILREGIGLIAKGEAEERKR